MRQIARLKKQRFLSFTKNTKILLENCVYFLFHWFSGENSMFLLSLHKGRQTSKELKKRNINHGTIVFLMSLFIIFFITKRDSGTGVSCEFCKFSKNTFLTEFLQVAAYDF